MARDWRQEVPLQHQVAKILAVVHPRGQVVEQVRQVEEHLEHLEVDSPTVMDRNLVEALPMAVVHQNQAEEPYHAAAAIHQASAAEARGGRLLAEAGSKNLDWGFRHYHRACPSSFADQRACAGEIPIACEVHPCFGASQSRTRAPLRGTFLRLHPISQALQ